MKQASLILLFIIIIIIINLFKILTKVFTFQSRRTNLVHVIAQCHVVDMKMMY